MSESSSTMQNNIFLTMHCIIHSNLLTKVESILDLNHCSEFFKFKICRPMVKLCPFQKLAKFPIS